MEARVLINGAGGGVGTIGVQLAKPLGVELTGVDSEAKLEMLTRLGFDHVIDYQKEDFTRNGQRYDLIVDAKTNRSPFAYVRSLEKGGTYATVGGAMPRLLQTLLLGPLIRLTRGRTLRVIALKPNKDLRSLSEAFEAGQLKPVIDGPYPLAAAPEAFRRFGEAKHLGKIVITL